MKRVLATLALLIAFAFGQATTLPSNKWLALKLFPGTLLEATYLPTPFKSIQSISVTVTGALSNTGTISPAVTTTNTILVWQGDSNNQGSAGGTHEGWTNGYFTLTNGTTVTLTAGSSTTVLTGNVQVIEFAPGVLKSSTQCGAITFSSGTTGTATITSVNTAKTMLVSTGFTDAITGVASADANFVGRLSLTNATTVTSSYPNGSGGTGAKHGYCVAEGK